MNMHAPRVSGNAAAKFSPADTSPSPKFRCRFRILDSGRICTVKGQEARTLLALCDAGARGITALEVSTWALRLAHYCLKLRKQGLSIPMEREDHAGPVKGWHGRYRLETQVEILGEYSAKEAA